jgi:uncharacterized protein YceK
MNFISSLIVYFPRQLILISTLIVILSGCAPSNYSIKTENITPEDIAIAYYHKGTVVLTVDGGWDTPFLGLQLMPNGAVMDALKAAIEKSNLFESISDDDGNYHLVAFIFDIDQPLLGGGETTVSVEIAWTLSLLDTGTILWQESILTSHTTPSDAAFNLMERVNIASEEATKANIRIALEQISKINF